MQLPQNLFDLRTVIDPLATTLQWLTASKWVFGMVLCVGAGVLASCAIGQLVERHRRPFQPLDAK